MKDHKKFITFLILLAMFVLVSVPTFAANDLGVEYSAVLDQQIISVSDEAQTIVMTVKTNNPVDLDSITAQVILPEGFSVTAITNDTLGFVKGDSNLNNGMIAWSYGYDEADYLTTDVLAVVTITVPAGTSAGSYVIAFDIMDITSDWGTTWEDGTTVSTTLTIKDVPACEHEYKYDCDKVCAKCGEETRPEAKHEYTNPCDAHCAICHELTNEDATHTIVAVDAVAPTCTETGNVAYWYCSDCGSAWLDAECTMVTNLKSVILPAGHSFLEGKRGTQLSAGDCVTPATYATKCDRCDVEDKTKVITGEKNPDKHNVIHVEAKEADCVNDGNLEHWYCSECEQYWIDAELTENTNKDAVIIRTTGHSKVAVNNGNGTHRIDCCVCLTVLEDNIPHDFTSGEADNTCICGKTYCEHGQLVYEANEDLGHFVKCALCGDEIGYESHVGEYYIVHIDLGQIAIAIDCKDCGYNAVTNWYSNPEVSTQPGTCLSPAVTTYVFNIEELPSHAKEALLGDIVYAPEKDGETDLIYRVNEDNWTVVITVIGELDFNNHVSSEVSYQKINDEQHTVYHPCCKATETVAHTADKKVADATCQHGEIYACVCGAEVETTAPDTTKHVYEPLYENNGDGTHKVTYMCCGAVVAEAEKHTFNQDFVCNCGKVKEFYISWTVDGKVLAEIYYEYGSVVTAPEAPTKDGYTFGGWNVEPGFTMPGYNVGTISNKAWIPNEYTIYNDWAQIAVGRFYGETIEMAEPGREGYVFKGWEFYTFTYNESTEEFTLLEKYDGTTMPAFDLYAKSKWECNHDSDFHDYETKHDGSHHWNVCKCGQTVGEKIPHDQNEVLYGGNCKEPTVYRCSCGYEYNGEKNPDNHASDNFYQYKDTDGDTHTTYHPCCGKDIETLPHDYTTGDAEYTCVCGAKYTGWDDRNYILNGDIQYTGWTLIDGDWYYLHPITGHRAWGLTRVPYNTELGHGALAEDLAYNPNFKDAEEAWYYFDEDGKYEINKNGILDGKYVKNGMIAWHPGFVTVGGELYYFVGDKENGGNIWANGDVIVSRLNGEDFVKGGVYNFINGKLNTAMHGIVKEATTGKMFYYINGHRQKGIGLTQIEPGKYIYVRSNGELATGVYYSGEFKYEFDEDGYTTGVKNGIINDVYYVNGHVGYGTGLIEINGNYYYVKSNGEIVKNTAYYVTKTNGYVEKGTKLYFDEDGKMYTPAVKNGIVEENGGLFYYVDGVMAKGAGVVKMTDENGVFYIYVKFNGQLATGKYWPTTLNGELERGEYDWGTDGKYYPEG